MANIVAIRFASLIHLSGWEEIPKGRFAGASCSVGVSMVGRVMRQSPTDMHGRALCDVGSVILGLYAAGNASGPVVGHTYRGPGGTIGRAMTFGYLAALHIAESQLICDRSFRWELAPNLPSIEFSWTASDVAALPLGAGRGRGS